jgi:hypothetical protein
MRISHSLTPKSVRVGSVLMILFGVSLGAVYATEATVLSSFRYMMQVLEPPFLCLVLAYGILRLNGFHYWLYMLLSVLLTIVFVLVVGIGDAEPVAPTSERAGDSLALLAILLWLSSLAALLLPSNVRLFWWRLDELPE